MNNFEKNLEKALNNAKRLTDKILIDGKLISAQTNNKIPVLNPSTGENIFLLKMVGINFVTNKFTFQIFKLKILDG